MKIFRYFVFIFFVIALDAKNLPSPVRGIYLNPYSCSNARRIASIVDSMKKYKLNTVVIDVKADNGKIPFKTKNPLLGRAAYPIYNLDSIVSYFHRNNILLIGRIVTFKDPIRARMNGGEYAVLDKFTSRPWQDSGGAYWVDPYNIDNWDYNIEVAREVLKRGFDSVQFDYVRFPSDGNIGLCKYPGYQKGYYYSDIIAMFAHYAKFKLKDYDIGIDVFGYLPWLKRIINIGQDMSMITAQVDIVSPMLYPSHFGDKFLLKNGDYFKRTYDIIRGSLIKAQKYTSKGQRIIPFLQSFTYKQSKMGKFYVENQINAAISVGDGSYYVWNAGSNYSLLWKALNNLNSMESTGRAMNYIKLKEYLFNETSRHRDQRI
ncbi:MAG TPA: hypothetical protein ENJ25_00695 [Firmicutes bacterium]|uniref:DUF4015 domain-containing protein n=1 Tax=candidate division TA06 bacterium TaxID=2250710 RepID=A0A660SAY9_UNCT6|nr:hypothetical protein [candidate division WOR-3 bacterium]RKX67833.1 MAG: hypothetical protein DRP44_01335 [candidate division TA06 bacterium]HFD04645.1 hypothetical protein [Bacillota bacterium]